MPISIEPFTWNNHLVTNSQITLARTSSYLSTKAYTVSNNPAASTLTIKSRSSWISDSSPLTPMNACLSPPTRRSSLRHTLMMDSFALRHKKKSIGSSPNYPSTTLSATSELPPNFLALTSPVLILEAPSPYLRERTPANSLPNTTWQTATLSKHRATNAPAIYTSVPKQNCLQTQLYIAPSGLALISHGSRTNSANLTRILRISTWLQLSTFSATFKGPWTTRSPTLPPNTIRSTVYSPTLKISLSLRSMAMSTPPAHLIPMIDARRLASSSITTAEALSGPPANSPTPSPSRAWKENISP